MTRFDDLFQTEDHPGGNGEQVCELPLSELFSFRNHPFKVDDDESMQDMVESVRQHGVLVPGIVRKSPEGHYELIAGHRRKRASELAGKATMPVVIRELDNDEAVLAMVDSNIQREDILPSEKAWAYKMKLDAIRRRAGRPSANNSRQVGENFSVEIVSQDSGDSARNIHRYIRLTCLLPEILQMVDDKKLPFNPAVELSYLEEKWQKRLWEQIEKLGRRAFSFCTGDIKGRTAEAVFPDGLYTEADGEGYFFSVRRMEKQAGGGGKNRWLLHRNHVK